ncbi:MAG: hypothetical protein K6B72_10920 [Lachnospiraceae bacterium]|nr:hypothetical protein [Lachnospiraceae bacterium]
MRNRPLILLRALLLSTSQGNILKHSTDKKKKKRIVGGIVGAVVLYILLMAYSILMCIGYGQVGLIDAAPVMCALIISMLAFIFTVLKTNGYLFNFKEYDMLMSLPFEASTVAACKFLYMYIKSLPWYLSISVSMMIGYGVYAKPAFYVYPIWIILGFFLPVIPMLAAAFLGFLIARIGAGFRKTNIVQTVLTMIFIIFCFSLRFIIEGIFKDDKVTETLEMTSQITDNAAGVYLPARWFSDAVTGNSVLGILLLAGVSAALFAAVFALVGRSYRNINSALRSHAAARNFRMTGQKKHSVVQAIAFKEFRRLTGSTVYITNAAIGEVLALLLGIVTLIFGFDTIVSVVTQGAPIDTAILRPAIPFTLYFFVGMMSTTACSPSLEGKNYWIVQSLPIEKKTLYQGKMLFNLYLTIPVMAFSTLCMCVSAGVPVLDTILYLLLGAALCAFSTAWGCVCGVKHMRLDWENEIEVVKQGSAVAIYLLPNMFVVMGLVVLVVFLGMRMDHRLLALILILIASLLAALSYLRVLSLSRRRF